MVGNCDIKLGVITLLDRSMYLQVPGKYLSTIKYDGNECYIIP